MTTKRACSLCGGPLRRTNRINICSRTDACRRAAQKRHSEARRDGRGAAAVALHSSAAAPTWPKRARPAQVLQGAAIALYATLDELERLLALARRATEQLARQRKDIADS